MRERVQEIIITLVFVAVLILLLNPFGFWMPTELTYIMLGGVLVLFFLYVGLTIKERPQDEREQLHRFFANRAAAFYGSIVLVAGIIYQGLSGYEIDPWLGSALGIMVIAKLLSLLYSDKHR